jgi:hypothetical protein
MSKKLSIIKKWQRKISSGIIRSYRNFRSSHSQDNGEVPALPEGAVYGFAQTVQQSSLNRLSQKTKIKGLFKEKI